MVKNSKENNMPIPQEHIDSVREYALDHYELDGWDYLIEAISDDEIRAQFASDKTPTYREFFNEMKEWMQLLDSHRRDIQGTAF
jgi:hypothetical protein